MFTDAIAKFAPALHLAEMQDYLAWMLDGWSTQISLTDEEFRGADGPTLHRLARSMLKEWPSPVRRIVDEANIAATFPVSLRSARPVKLWQTTNVTLLGDAIHTMSPGRGEGANTALRDAELLRHALVDVETLGVSFVQAKAQYETAMLRYGFEAVANSLEYPFAASTNRVKRTSQTEKD